MTNTLIILTFIQHDQGPHTARTLRICLTLRSKRVEKDLVKILEHLENERDKRLSGREKEEKITLTNEERELGLSFLKNPALFQEIIDDMTTLGYVGEDLNKQLLYICASSRILRRPDLNNDNKPVISRQINAC